MILERVELVKLIDRFIAGEDRSIKCANELEAAINDAFPEDEYLQDTVLMLASYRPGGDEYLYDEEAMKCRLIKSKAKIVAIRCD